LKILELKALPLSGAFLIVFARFHDKRGYFTEVFRQDEFDALAPQLGLKELKVQQTNESRSHKGVVRGLHLQFEPAMGKLVRLLYGRAVDMALDVRKGSKSFGKLILVELRSDFEAESDRWIWLPPGLAHGTFYLEESAIEYHCTAQYNPKGEVGLDLFDPQYDLSLCSEELTDSYLAFIKNNPIISEKDAQALTLAGWQADPRSGAVTL
jgi:dTDP-4-dehydrorhamnose 3,5-epimerase